MHISYTSDYSQKMTVITVTGAVRNCPNCLNVNNTHPSSLPMERYEQERCTCPLFCQRSLNFSRVPYLPVEFELPGMTQVARLTQHNTVLAADCEEHEAIVLCCEGFLEAMWNSIISPHGVG